MYCFPVCRGHFTLKRVILVTQFSRKKPGQAGRETALLSALKHGHIAKKLPGILLHGCVFILLHYYIKDANMKRRFALLINRQR